MATNVTQRGFSLVTVVAMGAVVMTWLLVLTGLVLPTYYKAVESRYYNVLRSSAEGGLDYAVSQLNSAIGTGSTSPMDAITLGASTQTVVPDAVIGVPGAKVTIKITNVSVPSTSTIYNQYLDFAVASPPLQASNGKPGNGWRVVEATATYAPQATLNGFVFLTKKIRVILQPSYSSASSTGNTVPYFPYAVLSAGLIGISNNVSTDGYNSNNGPYGGSNVDPFGGSIASNQQINLSNNANIGGSVFVNSLPYASNSVVSATASNNAVVKDMVVVNGITPGFVATPGPTPQSSDNVDALGGTPSTPRIGARNTSPVIQSQSNVPFNVPAAPSSPSTAYDVGAINISGNATVVVKDGASMPQLPLNVSKGTTYMPPGSYKATSFTMSNNATLTIDSSVTQPLKIFLEGSCSGTSVFTLTNNTAIQNNTGKPANFQVFYNGSKNITLGNNGTLRGVIYAPVAKLNILNNLNLYGAVVCQTTSTTNNTFFHYDEALSSTSIAGSYGLTYLISNSMQPLSGLHAVSWQEE